MADMKVAVYGTLMTGEANYKWGENARDRRPCTIKGRLYDTGYGYPAFVPDERGRDIEAEIITVDEQGLKMLDRLEGYPYLYTRQTVGATVDGRLEWAMVYVMNELPMRAVRIDSDSWRKRDADN